MCGRPGRSSQMVVLDVPRSMAWWVGMGGTLCRFGGGGKVEWVSARITTDLTPQFRHLRMALGAWENADESSEPAGEVGGRLGGVSPLRWLVAVPS